MSVTVLCAAAGRRPVGDVWPIVVKAFETPTVTVTLPDSTTTTVTAEAWGWCRYRADYLITVAGRHLAAVTTSTGRADLAVLAVAPTPAGQMPQLADASAYLGAHSATDEQIQEALDAETAAQYDVCVIPAYYPPSLRNALLRRVARNLAMMRLPLAVVQGDADAGGATLLPSWDPEITRLEGPHRRLLVG